MRPVFLLVCVLLMCIVCNGTKESFFPDPVGSSGICAKVSAGKYPPIALDGILDQRTCDEIVRVAEQHAKENNGWQTDRHQDYPTTDFDTADIPTLKFPIANIVYRKIIPKMAKAYKLDPLKLGITEVFIAKYSADKGQQKSLGTHVDGSDFSFVISLNKDFQGGGTKFVRNDTVKKPEIGSAIGFCGQTRHQGLKVTSGTRYILAGFLSYETPDGCSGE